MNYTLPTRADHEYTKINKFKKYEYTHCIAYELARRNTHVENSLNLLFELFSYYEQVILPTLTKYEKESITDDMIDVINDVENVYREFFIGLVSHYDKKQFAVDFKNLTFKNIKEKISYLVNILIKELYNKYYIIYQHESESFTHDFSEIYNPLTYLERDKALTEHIENTYGNDVSLKEYYKFNYDKNEYFTIFQDINKNEKEFSFSTIYPNFRMGIRDFTDTKVVLNLNLSKDEIIDYIKKIKDEYDQKNSIIKSSRQLLEEELDSLTHNIDILNSTKWGDIFFIYDYFFNSYKLYPDKEDEKIREEIQRKLTHFHGVKILKKNDEIKNEKDTKYKLIPWDEYKKLPEYNIDDESFGTFDNEKAYLSRKTITYKYDKIKNFIEGDNPKYKTLIHRFTS